MDLKNLMSHAVRPVNPTTTGELPAPELAQLSEEDLQQIIGGVSIDLDIDPGEWSRELVVLDNGELKTDPKHPGVLVVTGAPSSGSDNLQMARLIYSGGAVEIP